MNRFSTALGFAWIALLLLGTTSCNKDSGPASVAAVPAAKCTVADATAATAASGFTVADISDLSSSFPKTSGGVVDIPANGLIAGSPEVCVVTGTIVTNSTSGSTANFGVVLPVGVSWNQKFMFRGCGGNCGAVFAPGPPTWDQLTKGYAVWSTDDGHLGSNSTWETTSTGALNTDAITDLSYRAVHTVVTAGKAFTQAFYGSAPQYSYYSGCSDGGREGMVEVNRYPEDFDGYLVGDPEFDVSGQNLNISNATVQLQASDAALTPDLFALASTLVTAKCDALDGTKDGLIQNPAACNFNPQTDLPLCSSTGTTQCFTQNQINSLASIVSGITDPTGLVVHPGYPISNMNSGAGYNVSTWVSFGAAPSNLTGPEPWTDLANAPAAWSLIDPLLATWPYNGTPNYNSLTTLGLTYAAGGPGPVQFFHTTVPTATASTVYSSLNVASADFPVQAANLIQQNRKLIMYHGFSDGFITPYRTDQYYKALAGLHGGYSSLQKNVALFMVPGMYHCEGGPGPNIFGQDFHFIGGANVTNTELPQTDATHDALTALEQWVEKGVAPQQLIATKFTNDDPTQPALRTMPLCLFPAMARYSGSGDVNNASNWTCPTGDTSLLTIGLDGIQAGASSPLFTGYQ